MAGALAEPVSWVAAAGAAITITIAHKITETSHRFCASSSSSIAAAGSAAGVGADQLTRQAAADDRQAQKF
jgi:hypothetical protein